MKVTELMKRFEDEGWILFNARGDHYQYRHPDKKGKITLPPPRSNIPEEFARDIGSRAVTEAR